MYYDKLKCPLLKWHFQTMLAEWEEWGNLSIHSVGYSLSRHTIAVAIWLTCKIDTKIQYVAVWELAVSVVMVLKIDVM